MLRFFYVIFNNLFRAPFIINKLEYEAKNTEKYSEEERYDLARYVIKLMKRSGWIVTKAFGLDNLPKDGGYIMFPNHQGKFDALAIMITHDKPCSIVIDDAKSHGILVREFIDDIQGKRLVKGDIRQNVRIIREMANEAKEGRKFIIFPEGGYTAAKKSQLTDFKPGSFKSAVIARVPIVPVVLIDSYKVFNAWNVGKVTTQIHYLKPILFEEYQGMTTVEIANMVQYKIKAAIERVTLENEAYV